MFSFKKYPQNIWTNLAISMLQKEDLNGKNIIDAPCGNGHIAFHVAEVFKNNKVYAFDIDKKQLNSVYLRTGLPNLIVEERDIFTLKLESNNNIWLFINSLYCLPDTDKLMENCGSYMDVIIAVFPRIDSLNFITFEKLNPQFDNPSKMSINDTVLFFAKYNFTQVERIDCTGVAFHKWNNFFNKIRLPNKLRNFIFTTCDYLIPSLSKEYVIIKFKRNA